jgi:hypothetical protein
MDVTVHIQADMTFESRDFTRLCLKDDLKPMQTTVYVICRNMSTGKPVIPPELIEILLVKSTKKESTKFSSKIAALLSWIGDDPAREELVGLKLIAPNEISIKKQILAATFQIQNDSLMINLKRQNFSFLRSELDWSIFSLPSNFSLDHPNFQTPRTPTGRIRLQLPETVPSVDSAATPGLSDRWKLILDNRDRTRIPLASFLARFVDIFGIKSLNRSDMLYLLSLVTFTTIPGFVNFNDFAQLYANFGEKNSVFPKLIGFLNSYVVANGYVVFECIDKVAGPSEGIKIYFWLGSSFGFMMMLANGRPIHIKNDFDIPFFSKYLVDENGKQYQTWEEVLAEYS